MQVAAFWVGVWSASLFPVQTESHRRKLFAALSATVESLWSLKVTETQLRLCWDWTFQVEVKEAKTLAELKKNKPTYWRDSPDTELSSVTVFKQADLHRPW